MAEKRGKFAALADLNRAEPEVSEQKAPASRQVDASPVAPPDMGAGKGRVGRPATGKRSNPEFKTLTHYLKRKTHRAAMAKLLAEDDGRDLSDLLQELLEKWLKS